MASEPRIIGFLCNWCSYTGADLAGVAKMKTSPNVRIIRTMCSGRIDPEFILKAFRKGADGVLVSGCHFGDCHYQEGNFKAMRRVAMLKRILSRLGISPERLKMVYISASEGDVWARTTFEFTEAVRALGPFDRTRLNALYPPGNGEEEKTPETEPGEIIANEVHHG